MRPAPPSSMRLLLVGTLLSALGAPAAAHANGPGQAAPTPATGFMLQPVLGVGMSVVGGSTGAAFSPSLRLGGMWRRLAFAGELGYAGVNEPRDDHQGANLFTAGAVVEPFVWRSRDDRARLYLLAGASAGVAVSTSSTGTRSSWPVGSVVGGIGGTYFLHPSFALGGELGLRASFFNGRTFAGNDELLAVTYLYAALSVTFVAGRAGAPSPADDEGEASSDLPPPLPLRRMPRRPVPRPVVEPVADPAIRDQPPPLPAPGTPEPAVERPAAP